MPVSRNRKDHKKKAKARTLAMKGAQKKFQAKLKDAYMKQMQEMKSDVVQNDEVIENINTTQDIDQNPDV